jgi:hypothetical protein
VDLAGEKFAEARQTQETFEQERNTEIDASIAGVAAAGAGKVRASA